MTIKLNTMVTIGPISDNHESISKIASKTSIFRLNGSHNSLKWHIKTIKIIRDCCSNAFILMDIPGIKNRTCNESSVNIFKNENILFGQNINKSSIKSIKLTNSLPKFKDKMKSFSINDGQFEFSSIEKRKNMIIGKSKSDFELLPKKGLNFPGSLYDEKLQKEIYLKFINKIKNLKVDAIGLSFVQTGELVKEIKEKNPNVLIISKIENSEGLKNMNPIISYSDAIMIDRGDLGAEIGNEYLFDAVEKISRATKLNGKALIMGTENLESMVIKAQPSKSEVISLGHSYKIGVDCIMLSEETAISKNFLNTVKWITNFSIREKKKKEETLIHIKKFSEFPELWKAVYQIKNLPVILLSKSGYSLFDIMSLCQSRIITILTNNNKIFSLVKLYREKVNVIKIPTINRSTSDQFRKYIIKYKSIFFKKNKKIIAINVSHYINKSRANNLTIYSKENFD